MLSYIQMVLLCDNAGASPCDAVEDLQQEEDKKFP